jgi:hypothetical protein
VILEKVAADISAKDLVADRLIDQIFKSSEIVPITAQVYGKASMRSALGNPPGKNDSIGDAVNWALLLDSVPDNEDVHIISEDGDFFSTLDDQNAHPFLVEEWERVKGARLFVYRTLSGFMSEHFDGVAFSFDKDKEALIEGLFDSGSFAQTHSIISKLENYRYFSAKEVIRILDAAHANNQFGGIITDYDVSDFLNRIAVPQMSNITSEEHRKTLKTVIEEKRERVILN